ncbi:hypothetical protein AF332_16805 [Sporosarcina globispora]|uniref:Uncharacterized protein n=1 Tax=Sporosarcina globispora TaxID=1459 RepID=A0A0M0GEE8_SPOGL|nr:hypothetical protein [Sporosarcina globispora]KON88295.1 hypothetical protein AF332_16805 [Sporosarcina globispora]
MTTMIAKEDIAPDYKSLQAEWKEKDRELLLVGRQTRWLYWPKLNMCRFANTYLNIIRRSASFII